MTAVIAYSAALLALGGYAGAFAYRWALRRALAATLAQLPDWEWPERPDGRPHAKGARWLPLLPVHDYTDWVLTRFVDRELRGGWRPHPPPPVLHSIPLPGMRAGDTARVRWDQDSIDVVLEEGD